MAILAIRKAPKAKNNQVAERRPETPEERYQRILAKARAYGLADPEQFAERDIEVGLPGCRTIVGYVPAAMYPTSPKFQIIVDRLKAHDDELHEAALNGKLFPRNDKPEPRKNRLEDLY